jgi:hypothetical protein
MDHSKRPDQTSDHIMSRLQERNCIGQPIPLCAAGPLGLVAEDRWSNLSWARCADSDGTAREDFRVDRGTLILALAMASSRELCCLIKRDEI